ncbi:hypothetical protein J22TS3_27330 [Paenibacillus sp. J22TS3]|nr:hypothetical protein J22TS3_27330 [Paenibacillus sp. J22TS3]
MAGVRAESRAKREYPSWDVKSKLPIKGAFLRPLEEGFEPPVGGSSKQGPLGQMAGDRAESRAEREYPSWDVKSKLPIKGAFLRPLVEGFEPPVGGSSEQGPLSRMAGGRVESPSPALLRPVHKAEACAAESGTLAADGRAQPLCNLAADGQP